MAFAPTATITVPIDVATQWVKNGTPMHGMFTTRTTLTPAFAADVLDHHNTNNRPLRYGHVETLTQLIRRGEWKLTHQGIAFRDDGVLHDGQHRLHAVRAADKPVDMLIAWNVPDGTMDIVDTGVRRTPGDAMALNGYADSGYAATTVKVLWKYRNGDWSAKSVTSPQLVELAKTEPGVVEALPEARRMHRRMNIPASVVAVLLYLSRRSDAAAAGLVDVDAWFHALSTGEMLQRGMPAYQLRAWLANRVADRRRLSHRDAVGAYGRAWAAHLEHRTLGNIRWNPEDPVVDIEHAKAKPPKTG